MEWTHMDRPEPETDALDDAGTAEGFRRAAGAAALFSLISAAGVAVLTVIFGPSLGSAAVGGFWREGAMLYAFFGLVVGYVLAHVFWDFFLFRTGMISRLLVFLALGAMWASVTIGVLLGGLIRPADGGQNWVLILVVGGVGTVVFFIKARGEFFDAA